MSPDQRAAYVKGLRHFADLLEEQPAIPLPCIGRLVPICLAFLHDGTSEDAAAQREAMFMAAGSFPVAWEPAENGSDSPYVRAEGRLHGLLLGLTRLADPAPADAGTPSDLHGETP